MDKLKSFYLETVKKRKYPAFFFLRVLSWLYCFLVYLKNKLYDAGVLPEYQVSAFVISVGNINWGGSGKTSLVLKLADLLNLRFSLAVLRRGWGSDEEKLLRESLRPEVRLFSGKNRIFLAKKASLDSQVIILDDGFQYRKLQRNLDIVLLNAEQDFSSFCLPAGPLREKALAIKRADIAILRWAGDSKENNTVIEEKLKAINPQIEVYSAFYRLRRLVNLKSGKEDSFKKAALFTAIGWPQQFSQLLLRAQVKIEEKFIFPDHSLLNRKQWEEVERICHKNNIDSLIITAKDKIRVRPTFLKVLVAEADFVVEPEDAFKKRIENEIAKYAF